MADWERRFTYAFGGDSEGRRLDQRRAAAKEGIPPHLVDLPAHLLERKDARRQTMTQQNAARAAGFNPILPLLPNNLQEQYFDTRSEAAGNAARLKTAQSRYAYQFGHDPARIASFVNSSTDGTWGQLETQRRADEQTIADGREAFDQLKTAADLYNGGDLTNLGTLAENMHNAFNSGGGGQASQIFDLLGIGESTSRTGIETRLHKLKAQAAAGERKYDLMYRAGGEAEVAPQETLADIQAQLDAPVPPPVTPAPSPALASAEGAAPPPVSGGYPAIPEQIPLRPSERLDAILADEAEPAPGAGGGLLDRVADFGRTNLNNRLPWVGAASKATVGAARDILTPSAGAEEAPGTLSDALAAGSRTGLKTLGHVWNVPRKGLDMALEAAGAPTTGAPSVAKSFEGIRQAADTLEDRLSVAQNPIGSQITATLAQLPYWMVEGFGGTGITLNAEAPRDGRQISPLASMALLAGGTAAEVLPGAAGLAAAARVGARGGGRLKKFAAAAPAAGVGGVPIGAAFPYVQGETEPSSYALPVSMGAGISALLGGAGGAFFKTPKEIARQKAAKEEKSVETGPEAEAAPAAASQRQGLTEDDLTDETQAEAAPAATQAATETPEDAAKRAERDKVIPGKNITNPEGEAEAAPSAAGAESTVTQPKLKSIEEMSETELDQYANQLRDQMTRYDRAYLHEKKKLKAAKERGDEAERARRRTVIDNLLEEKIPGLERELKKVEARMEELGMNDRPGATTANKNEDDGAEPAPNQSAPKEADEAESAAAAATKAGGGESDDGAEPAPGVANDGAQGSETFRSAPKAVSEVQQEANFEGARARRAQETPEVLEGGGEAFEGTKAKVRFKTRIVEADSLNIQRSREHGDFQNRKWHPENVVGIIKGFEPSRLTSNRRDLGGGPPVIYGDVIIAGNHRVGAIQGIEHDNRFNQLSPDQQAQYIEEIAKATNRTPESIADEFENPVLVREIQGDPTLEDLNELVKRSNFSEVAVETGSVRSKNLAEDMLKSGVFDNLDKNKNPLQSPQVQQVFLENIDQNLLTAYRSEKGGLTGEGKRALKDTLLAAALRNGQNDENIKILIEAGIDDANSKIASALDGLREVGQLATLGKQIDDGKVAQGYDLRYSLSEVLNEIKKVREGGGEKIVDIYSKMKTEGSEQTLDISEEGLRRQRHWPMTDRVWEIFYKFEDGLPRNARSKAEISAILRQYINEVQGEVRADADRTPIPGTTKAGEVLPIHLLDKVMAKYGGRGWDGDLVNHLKGDKKKGDDGAEPPPGER